MKSFKIPNKWVLPQLALRRLKLIFMSPRLAELVKVELVIFKFVQMIQSTL